MPNDREVHELKSGLWHWQAPHPGWRDTEPWDKRVSCYAIDNGEYFLLVDPLSVPDGLLEKARGGRAAVLLTCPWHERDTESLVQELNLPVYTTASDSAQDLIDKFGITAEQAGDGSPDLVWLLKEGKGEARLYERGEISDLGIEAFEGREQNDMVIWVDSCEVVISGDTLVDFGEGLQIAPWLRASVTREEVMERLKPLLSKPASFVLPTHGLPTDKAALENALK